MSHYDEDGKKMMTMATKKRKKKKKKEKKVRLCLEQCPLIRDRENE